MYVLYSTHRLNDTFHVTSEPLREEELNFNLILFLNRTRRRSFLPLIVTIACFNCYDNAAALVYMGWTLRREVMMKSVTW